MYVQLSVGCGQAGGRWRDNVRLSKVSEMCWTACVDANRQLLTMPPGWHVGSSGRRCLSINEAPHGSGGGAVRAVAVRAARLRRPEKLPMGVVSESRAGPQRAVMEVAAGDAGASSFPLLEVRARLVEP